MEENERVVQKFNERLTLSLELTFGGNLIFSEGLNVYVFKSNYSMGSTFSVRLFYPF